MNPFDYLIPGTVVIVFLVFPAVMMYRAGRPTESEQRAYNYGYEDGDLGAVMLDLENPTLHEIYLEGYIDGSRGRTRRADAEKLEKRAAQGPARTES